MLDYFVGTIQEAQEQEIILDIGMLGLTLQVPRAESFERNTPIKIYSYLHWNAENGPSLFGFTHTIDRSIFKIIIS